MYLDEEIKSMVISKAVYDHPELKKVIRYLPEKIKKQEDIIEALTLYLKIWDDAQIDADPCKGFKF